ncbi:transketolase [Desulfonauticus submarinus]|uniref:Transketolase n=1 Tax=Desulfonauticus submarinus TaxID=206665 RepID=A0A1H0EBK2_9BACT|nr:transketolase [Desulfonauticus submarinus]SDN79663.1 transketolase [Desulfonauticus submarinus]
MENLNLDVKTVNVIKGLIIDAIDQAKSGHPGGAMSSADFGYVLFKDFLKFDPQNPKWFNRDRFILSAGHESMLLYSLLTLIGFLSIEDLKSFRQWKSKTPGHPECDLTPGVEATTGPLGQGFSMGVGMAIAEAFLRSKLGENICNHFTYVLASDGDLQEPVVLGSASLAGKWNLGKLIVFYDSNKIQLAGPTKRCDCTDYNTLFKSFNWQVLEVNGHSHSEIKNAILQAQKETSKPTLIIGHTIMAKGCATLEGSEKTHGSPLSPEEIKATKKKLGLPEHKFYLPKDVLEHFRSRFSELTTEVREWEKNVSNLSKEKKELFNLITDGEKHSFTLPDFPEDKPLATRKAFGMCLNALTDQLPNLLGGSADLDPSNQTVRFRERVGLFNALTNPEGRYLAFGVREFPMGAILNGLALHGGIIPFGATFLVFSDYERNALRMSALQKLPVLHIFTHDSFYVGEDGPTHQPIEHISSLRLIPNMLVFRPADANETKYCFKEALAQKSRPSILLFTRQTLPILNEKIYPQIQDGVRKGAYILKEPKQKPEIIFIATGSEVHLALEVANKLELPVRVISMPCMELFKEQPQSYIQSLLPSDIEKRIAFEAGRTDIWHQFIGLKGTVLGINHFGASAPANILAEEYGFTVSKALNFVQNYLQNL